MDKINKPNKVATLTYTQDLASLNHLSKMSENLNRSGLLEQVEADSLQFFPNFDLQKRKFVRQSTAFFLRELLPREQEDADEKERGILHLLFGGYNFKSTYHFHKKVKYLTGDHVTIEGKTVVQEISLIELMKSGVHPGFSVKLK